MRTLVLAEGLRPSGSPTRALARRFAGALRSRGSLAALARTAGTSGRIVRQLLVLTAALLAPAVPSAAVEPAQTMEGTWHARLQESWSRDAERWMSFQLERAREYDRHFGMSVRLSDLDGLGTRDERLTARGVRFALRRDAGSVTFEGDFRDGRGAGTWDFSPNGEFVAAMRKTFRELSQDEVLKMALIDVSRSFAQSVQGQTSSTLSVDDLIKMRIHGVDRDYIDGMRKAGYDKLTTEELVKTRIHGASPSFIQEMRAAGYEKLPIESLIKMRIHGVSPEFVREMRDLGYKSSDVEDLVKLRIHGVTPAFIREMRELGYKETQLSEFVKFRIHGVTAQFVRELRDLGYSNLRAEDLVRMKIHGVTPAFIRDVKAAGFKDMSPDDLVDFSIHGGKRWLARR